MPAQGPTLLTALRRLYPRPDREDGVTLTTAMQNLNETDPLDNRTFPIIIIEVKGAMDK